MKKKIFQNLRQELQLFFSFCLFNKSPDRIPYETGALLCLRMDELNIPDWQQKLNNQTSENPVTLYSIIDDFIHTA